MEVQHGAGHSQTHQTRHPEIQDLQRDIDIIQFMKSEQLDILNNIRAQLKSVIQYAHSKSLSISRELEEEKAKLQPQAKASKIQSEKFIRGKEASPYGYVFGDWKLEVPNTDIVKSETPSEIELQVKNPLIAFGLGVFEIFRKNDFTTWQKICGPVTTESLQWIINSEFIERNTFLIPSLVKEMFDDLIFMIRTNAVYQLYQEYDLIDEVLELCLRALLIVQSGNELIRKMAKTRNSGRDYEPLLRSLADIFKLKVEDSGGFYKFTLEGHVGYFRMLISEPTIVTLSKS